MVRFLGKLVILVVFAWAVGFGVFIATVPREADPALSMPLSQASPEETGIVALTGGGLSRIRAAIALMEEGHGARVLITGTHPDTKKQELAAYIENSEGLFDCCVDLGQRALTTRGNAIETRDWVAANGFSQIIVVTTDYHMHRAMAELRYQGGDLAITPWPVASPLAPAGDWMSSGKAWKALVTEYNKFLLVRAGQILRLE